jgi:photosystem II stability/assembly factor-like uncharacterized protein
MRYGLLLLSLFTIKIIAAQKIQVLDSGANTSLRGLSVVNNHIVWVSGSNGQVGLTLDAGKTWRWVTVKGYEKIDFRDIEAFSSTEAIIMGVGEPAYILKTIDAGKTWKLVFEDKRKGMFLDAMEFWNEMSGIVIGDPIDGKFFIARTFDGGNTWKGLPQENYPKADSGEALFAASGTNIRAINKSEAVFVTGGLKARLFVRDEKYDLPIIQGKETTGAFSIAVNNKQNMIVVGGDYANDTLSANNCYYKGPSYTTWLAPGVPPHGFRSCVEYITNHKVICCGTSGVDYSIDGGITWKLISAEGFHVVRKAKKGKAVYLAGANGTIGKLAE